MEGNDNTSLGVAESAQTAVIIQTSESYNPSRPRTHSAAAGACVPGTGVLWAAGGTVFVVVGLFLSSVARRRKVAVRRWVTTRDAELMRCMAKDISIVGKKGLCTSGRRGAVAIDCGNAGCFTQVVGQRSILQAVPATR